MDSVKIFLSTILYFLNFLLGLFFFILIRIYFEIEFIGILGILVSFFMLLTFILQLGFNSAHLKFFSESMNPEEEAKCNSTYLFYKLIQYLIFIIVVLILIPINTAFNFNHLIVYIFFVGKLFQNMGRSFFKIIFLSKKEVIKSSLPDLSSTLIKIILLISLLNFFIADIWLLIYIYLFTDLIYFILNLCLLKKFKLKKPNREFLVKYFKYSFPFFVITSLTIISKWIDLTIFSIWFSLDIIANYFTAKQLYTFIFLLFSGLPDILISTFSKNIRKERNEENLKIIKKADRILTLLVIPFVFLIILYSTKVLVFILGEDYRLTGQILSILSLNLIVMSVESATITELKALGKVKFLAKISILKASFVVILIITFVHPLFLNMGILGGALAIFISEVITQIIYRPIIYKKYGLGFYWGSIKNLIIMFSIYLLQIYINIYFNYPILFIPIIILFDLFLYILLLYFLKGLTKEDLRFLKELFKKSNIKTQIFLELKND